jgi:hypothetical protein
MGERENVKTKIFRVHEIEHRADEQASIEDLARAGCKNIKVLVADHEGSESVVIEADCPDGFEDRLGFACL